jgi:putative transposase
MVTRVHVINLRALPPETRRILDHLTYSAAKLWNIANHTLRQGTVTLRELKATFKTTFWYKNLHSQSAQAVLEALTVAWRNYYHTHAKKPPRFQPKDGHRPVKWKKQGFKVVSTPRGWRLRLSLSQQTKTCLRSQHLLESTFLWVSLPRTIPLKVVRGLQEVEIVPHDLWGHRFYVLNLIYRQPRRLHPQHRHGAPRGGTSSHATPATVRNMTIDLGITNLATVVIEGCRTPLILDGKALVSRFRWAAKTTARLQQRLEALTTAQGSTPPSMTDNPAAKGTTRAAFPRLRYRLARIVWQVRWFVHDYLHKLTRWLVDVATRLGVKAIHVGALSRGITRMDAGRRVNERLHRLPFGRFVRLLTYKAAEVGITVHLINEAYTSQACSRCGYRARANRRRRGWFHCQQCDFQLNADVNAARNMSWRVVPPSRWRDRAGNGDSGLGHPWRVRAWDAWIPPCVFAAGA